MGAIISIVVNETYMKNMSITLSVACFVACIIPISLLAYANGFVDHVIATVREATWKDFRTIGGRDR